MQHTKLYSFIQQLDAQELIATIPQDILPRCELIQVPMGKLVAFKGNCITHIYMSLQGKMEVKNEFENGFIYSFADIESLAYIGVMEVMADEEIYSSSLQTTTECIMLKISKEDFIKWINKDHTFALRVLQFLATSMYKQSVNKGEVLAYPAIYSLMSYLINSYKEVGEGVVQLTKSRDEIGSILGFSIRTVNRNLKQLKEQGLVCVTRQSISISKEQCVKLVEQLESIK